MNCIKIPEEREGYIHIQGVVSTNITLCGWVDVPYEEVVGTPTCPNCLAVVRFCKGLKI